ncbi:bifunctional riboflavin kinase/FAD synthetase [Propylenella binzhouense]|uniref:Riboflavin biosynthesis protein n=1 Tax=Propylenella binzhouense TaxID=2555902 RepID=A0A964T1C4_9HYPH|nr:bifunctional riboflavin kinase/FAD synthetase [Propylenella binzhouense]MYZ46515.1 bifunctional riboflavin kinase/FAD synthetase [Propylenella binzhouense]
MSIGEPTAPAPAAAPDIPDDWRGAVVAIGNFDGVHRGHQAVLAAARREAHRLGVKALILTFEPHPRAFFGKGAPFFRLTPAPLKTAVAKAFGMDGALVLPFDEQLARVTAEAFVRDVLVERLAIRHAATGYDFHFGYRRLGTPAFLEAAGASHGFGVTVVGEYDQAGLPVSSTRIRTALRDGDIDAANALLGWRWSIAGEIVHGDKRGRDLGYPTANMALDPAVELAHGIYAVRLARPDGSVHDGVASFGRRPTFDNGRALFETFLFDFSDDLYGATVLVALVGRIRPELRFESADALVAQMDADSIDARALLAHAPDSAVDAAIRHAYLTPR